MATSTLGSGTLVLAGTTSGTTTVTATAVAGTTTLTLPAATDTLVGKATTDTLTNKTLTGAVMNGTLGATTPSTVAATTLTTSSTVTHNGGTANGVAYLNGSKVLTSGSALVFDGTVLTLGTSSAFPLTDSKLSIGNDANSALRLGISNQNAGASALVGIDFEPAGGSWKIDVPSDTAGFVPPMYFKAGASTNVTFAYGGNVGIGTSSPLGRLHTSETNGVNYFESPGISSIGLQFRTNSTNRYRIGTPSGSNDLQFLAGGTTETMRLDSSGNLLVGKTAPSDSTVGFQVSSGGRVACGMASGDAYVMYSTSASAYRFYVTNAGVINATSTTITGISDIRLKENIRDLDDGLASVMALKPRKFDWKEGKGANIKDARGFIAQEFETVFPDMIDEWRDPAPEGEEPYKAINANLIPTLVKAIQEQQALITQLTARITALEGA